MTDILTLLRRCFQPQAGHCSCLGLVISVMSHISWQQARVGTLNHDAKLQWLVTPQTDVHTLQGWSVFKPEANHTRVCMEADPDLLKNWVSVWLFALHQDSLECIHTLTHCPYQRGKVMFKRLGCEINHKPLHLKTRREHHHERCWDEAWWSKPRRLILHS